MKTREKSESAAKKEGAEKSEKAETKGVVGGTTEGKSVDGQPLTINDGGEKAESERDAGADRDKAVEVAPYLHLPGTWIPKPEIRNLKSLTRSPKSKTRNTKHEPLLSLRRLFTRLERMRPEPTSLETSNSKSH